MTRARTILGVLAIVAAGIGIAIVRKDRHEPTHTEDVGFVLSITGDWAHEHSGPLSLGQAMKGGKITRTSEAGSLRIAMLDDTVTDCEADCRLPLTLGQQSSTGTRVFAVVKSLFAREPERFATLMSRGAGPREAIAQSEGGKTDLAAVLRPLRAAKYRVEIAPRSGGEPATFQVDWKPGEAAFVSLAPGLYVVTAGEESAWLLVTDTEAYARATEQWSEVVAKTESLPRDARVTVQRAWLEHLSRAM